MLMSAFQRIKRALSRSLLGGKKSLQVVFGEAASAIQSVLQNADNGLLELNDLRLQLVLRDH